MKLAGARTRTWTVTLTYAEWALAEAIRAQYGGTFGVSRADLVMLWVRKAADGLKHAHPPVAAALDGLEDERLAGLGANSIDHGGRRPTVNLSLLRQLQPPAE